MSVNQIKGKFVKLSNNEALKAGNAAASGEVEILKVSASDEIVLLDLPIVDDGVNPASNVATEAYVDGEISTVNGRIDDHVGGLAEKHDAADIVVSPIGDLGSLDVQAALEEIQADASQALSDAASAQSAADAAQGDINTHIAAMIDAHDASAISVFANGNLGSTDAQSALEELQGDIDTINTTLGGLSFAAEDISFVAAGNIIATDVQAAIEELDSEKVAKAGDTMSGNLTLDQSGGVTAVVSPQSVVISDTAGDSVIQMMHGSGLEVSFTDNTSISVSANYYEGGLELNTASLNTSTADGAIVVDSISGYSQTKTDYAGQSVGSVSLVSTGLTLTHDDQNSGDVLNAIYGPGSISLLADLIAGQAAFQVSPDQPVNNLASDGSAPAPTLDSHLTSKKYVDDQITSQSTALTNHLNDTVDAHDASAISFSAAGDIVATDVQAAIQELDSEKARIELSNLAATTAINSDLNFAKGAGVAATIRGKSYVAGEASGSFNAFSGGVSGGVNSGPLNLFSGNVVTGLTGNTGSVNIYSGYSAVNAGNDGTTISGQVSIRSGDTEKGNTGAVLLRSGKSFNDGTSGNLFAVSGDSVNGSTGLAGFGTGNSTNADSGDVYVYSGLAPNGTRGFIELDASSVNILSSNIDMMSHKIVNLTDGSAAGDAINKGQLDAGLALKLSLAGGTMSGNIVMGDNSITNLVMTSDPHSAATRSYVDSIAEGLHVHAPARLLANVDLGGTYNNGVDGVGAHIDFSSPISSIDGVTSFSVGDRIILAKQNGSSLDLENGIYFIEDSADIDVNGDITKLTRAVDFNTPTEMAGGDFVFVQEGSQYADTGWVMTETVVTVGTTPVQFLQFSGSGSYSAGDGLDLLGTEFSVNVSEIVGAALENDGFNNLAVKVDDISIEISADQLQVKDSGISESKLAFGSVTADKIGLAAVTSSKINSDVAGEGLGQDGFGALKVNTDSITIEISADQLQVKDSGISESKLAFGSVTADKIGLAAVTSSKINSDVAGDGLGQDGFGALKVNTDSITIEISADQLQVKDSGISESKLAFGSVTADKIGLAAVTSSKINSDVAGDGLGQDGFGALKVNADSITIEISADQLQVKDSGISESKLAFGSVTADKIGLAAVTAAKINSDVAGDGLGQDGFGALKVNAGNGIEISSDAVAIKLDGSSLSVSPSGLKSNIIWHKESYAITSTLSSGAFFDLDHVAEVDSISAFVDRLAIHEGASEDYSVDYTGGTGGVTRITFLNALVSPGQQQLGSGDTIFFKYQRKAA